MRKSLITLLLILAATLSGLSQHSIELAVNTSYYNSFSFGVEKMFTYRKIDFGPSVEFLNLSTYEIYYVDNDTFLMAAQYRIRLLQIEYSPFDRLTVGVAPIWMLGPLPRQGYYKTPSSIYARVRFYEHIFVEAIFTNSQREWIQLSLILKLTKNETP